MLSESTSASPITPSGKNEKMSTGLLMLMLHPALPTECWYFRTRIAARPAKCARPIGSRLPRESTR
jgi:hypothetical protein